MLIVTLKNDYCTILFYIIFISYLCEPFNIPPTNSHYLEINCTYTCNPNFMEFVLHLVINNG